MIYLNDRTNQRYFKFLEVFTCSRCPPIFKDVLGAILFYKSPVKDDSSDASVSLKSCFGNNTSGNINEF